MTESGEYARYNGVLGLYVSNNDRQRDGQRLTERVKGMEKEKKRMPGMLKTGCSISYKKDSFTDWD